jgi:hypothetical protein
MGGIKENLIRQVVLHERFDKPFGGEVGTEPLTVPGKVEGLYGLPVDTTTAFSDQMGFYNHSIEEQQRKLLENLSFLPPFLEPDEKILLVTTGCSPTSFLELLLTGVIIYSVKCSLFVVTNKRILHIPANRDLTYSCSIAQIRYADCRHIRVMGSTLIVKYKSSRTERFPCIRRQERKKLVALLKNMSFEGRTSPALERTHLCPRCTCPLIREYYACPHCSLPFKSKARTRTLSILFPGAGYFYTRHIVVGIVDAVVETLFMSALIAATVWFLMSHADKWQGLEPALVLGAVVLVFAKLVTVLHSNKFIEEFIPEQRRVDIRADQAASYRSKPKLEETLATGWRSR